MSEMENGTEVLEEGNVAGLDEETKDEEQGSVETIKIQIEQLLAAVGELQEQFTEKIARDEYKNTLFDKMHQDLIRYQNGVLDRLVEAMALDIIHLVDSTKHSLRVYEDKEASEDSYKHLLDVVRGIVEDLTDILYRQRIESYQVTGEEVDVQRQQILQTVETDEQDKNNLVAVRVADGYERVADGYNKDRKIIRPERIKIYKYSLKKTSKKI